MLFYFILIVLLAMMLSVAIIHLSSRLNWLVHKLDSHGVQKFHIDPVPSIGGFSVFLAFSYGLWSVGEESSVLIFFWVASLPIFLAGLVEDITLKIPPIWRLFFTFVSILVAYIYLGISVNSLGFEWTDKILLNYPFLALLFTLLVVGGAINSLNIIDGFNGLLGGYSILASLAVAYVSYILGDTLIMQLSLILTASVLGLFILNFPFGKIFMGDGGAYFVGFVLSILGLILVDRHAELSNWFVLLIFIYPMYELLYSIYRRKIIHKTDATHPDANHLHSLIYRKLISCDRFNHNKVICNSATSPFLWLLSLVGIIPAIIWYDNQAMMIISAFVFMFVYTIIYIYISSDRFKFNK